MLASWGDRGPGPHNGEIGRRLSERVTAVIQRQPSVSRVCDLGCGNGFLASQLGRHGYCVVGVDASARLLEIARTHYQSDTVEFRHATFGPPLAAALTADGLFDLVVSVDVIEHLYRPKTLIETAAAILKPGGCLVLCTPYHGYFKNVAISALGRWDAHHHVHFDGGHIKFFSVPTLANMLDGPFAVRGVEYYGRFPGFWKNMICIATRRA